MSEEHGMIVRLPDDILFRDYTQEDLDRARAAGERWAYEREKAVMEAVFGPLPGPALPEPDHVIEG